MADGQKTELSKNVLQMKFMQRSALRIEKELNEEDSKRDIDDEHWVLDLPATQKLENKFIIEPSLVRLENLRYGRMSFNGFNPEVEKLMKLHQSEDELSAAAEREKEIGVDDVEMADRYQSLVGTIGKKFSKKRQRSTMNLEEKDDNINADNNSSSLEKLKKRTDDFLRETMGPSYKKQKKKFMKPSAD